MLFFILFIISWFAVGIWSTYHLHIEDLKDARYDEDYFDGETVWYSLLSILFGYVTLGIVAFFELKERLYFVRLYRKLYYIANPDKKGTDEKE